MPDFPEGGQVGRFGQDIGRVFGGGPGRLGKPPQMFLNPPLPGCDDGGDPPGIEAPGNGNGQSVAGGKIQADLPALRRDPNPVIHCGFTSFWMNF